MPLNDYIQVGKKQLTRDDFLLKCYLDGVELGVAREQWKAEKRVGLWTHFKRVLRPRGAVVLFGSQPFTTELIESNRGWFKYCWTWDKKKGGNPPLSRVQPIKVTEDIVVFGKGGITYNPLMKKRDKPRWRGSNTGKASETTGNVFAEDKVYTHKYPKNIIKISNASQVDKLHPTQKPLALLEYLIRTYTNPGDLIPDPTIGSGTTPHAAVNLNRRCIGIEKDPGYFAKAVARIDKAKRETWQPELEL